MIHLLKRFFVCRKIGHSPSFYSNRPVCVRCHGALPGVWALDD